MGHTKDCSPKAAFYRASTRNDHKRGRCELFAHKVRHSFAKLQLLSVIQGLMTVAPLSAAFLLLEYVSVFALCAFVSVQLVMLVVSMVAFHTTLCLTVLFAKLTLLVSAGEFSLGCYSFACTTDCSYLDFAVVRKDSEVYNALTITAFLYGLLHFITAVSYLMNALKQCKHDCEKCFSDDGTPTMEAHLHTARITGNVAHHHSDCPKHGSSRAGKAYDARPSTSTSTQTACESEEARTPKSIDHRRRAAGAVVAADVRGGKLREVIVSPRDLLPAVESFDTGDVAVMCDVEGTAAAAGAKLEPLVTPMLDYSSTNKRSSVDEDTTATGRNLSSVNVFKMHPLPSVFTGYEGSAGDRSRFSVLADGADNTTVTGSFKSSRSVMSNGPSVY